MIYIYNKVKGQVRAFPFYLLALLLSVASCKEESDTKEEYANWQQKNETYFRQLVAEAKAQEGSTEGVSLLLLPRYSAPEHGDTELAYSDYIVAEELSSGPDYETLSPLGTDSVEVHYQGRLLPSLTYANGYVFDRSYPGTFDPATAVPSKLAVNKVIVGFATALMHMHRGDRWRVTIPYQLAYGTTATASVPAYSTLIFEIRLEDFWAKKKGDRH